MNVDGKQMRPIWVDGSGAVNVIDQRRLPHALEILTMDTVDKVIHAIQTMVVRGAPLIGVSGAYGVVVALQTTEDDREFLSQCQRIKNARPTAVNLAWAVERMLAGVDLTQGREKVLAGALREAEQIAEEEVDNCRRIGEHGAGLIAGISRKKGGRPVNILTHCNAGWLACVEYGTATAPIYIAHDQGIDLHVWVDETRPLNQGARLTAWELGKHGVKHTVITDNAGGHLMQHGRVDLVIVGTDRSTYTGDVANKIGTYLKALAAKDNNVPFYVALPSSTFDWQLCDGIGQIPIEERDPEEVRHVQGLLDGEVVGVLVPPADSPAGNPAFDVTPARLVTGFITERGICAASEEGILGLFPEKTLMLQKKRNPMQKKNETKHSAELSELEKKVIAVIQGDLPIVAQPYRQIAEDVGIEEDRLLELLDSLVHRGIIRRFGATLRHQKSGYTSNVMVAWQVDEARIDAVGKIMASFRTVTHCYRRNPTDQWPYNLYTMVHGRDEASCRKTAEKMAQKAGVQAYQLLFSRRELKKTSMRYFR